MSAKHTIIFLVFILCQSFTLTAQDYTDHNWYFTGNDTALFFGKGPRKNLSLIPGKLAQNNLGEKLTATDPTTGDLLFYSDGLNVYDGTHQVMQNGNGLNTDPNGIQALASSPVPGALGNDYHYIIHRSSSGEVFYSMIETVAQGNRTEGPPAGITRSTPFKNQATGITDRSDGMIVIGSRDGRAFWLITQNATTGQIDIHNVPELGQAFTPAGNLTLTNDQLRASHFSFHPGTGRIAIIPQNNTNIEVINFDETDPTLLTGETTILNSLNTNESFGGSAGWSFSGQFLYFSRNGTQGGLYRFNLNDTRSDASIETVDTYSSQSSLSLKLAPDSAIYQIISNTARNVFQLNRINQTDSAVNVLDIEEAILEDFNPQSSYFNQASPARNNAPMVSAEVQMGDLCQDTPIQFYPIFDPPTAIPDRILWDFPSLGVQSQEFAPSLSFDQAGPLLGTLTVMINGRVSSSMVTGTVIENTLELSLPDTTICPGETLTLDAEPQSSGGGGGGGGGGGSYEYLWSTEETTQTMDVTESGDYWVVVTPTGGGCPVYGTGRVTVYGDEGQTSNIWYFGNGAGLDFNEEEDLDPPPRSITEAHAMDAPAGTSTISDANGDVLFYTNGTSVWNRENGRMPNGTEIGGDSTAVQSVLIIPFVEDETMYYVFTTKEVYGDESYELKYSIVDMKADNGNGDVVLKDITLYANNTERLASLEGGNGYWLLAHEYGNNTFRAYPITENGIGTSVISSYGGEHSYNDPKFAQSGMKFSADGQRIAVSIVDGIEDYVELFDFDPNTGEVLEFEYRIDLNEGGTANDEVYDVHFSPGGNKLFASLNNRNSGSPGGRILEYRIDTFSTVASRFASRTVITETASLNVNYGQIQTGPNGAVYVAIETPGNPGGSTFVSQITANEDTTATSGFTENAVELLVGYSRLGLPNIVQSNANPQEEPSMSAPDETCVEERIEMTGSGTSDIDIFRWSITNQVSDSTIFSAEGQDTAYVFSPSEAGLFNISLNISNRCGYDTTLVQPIEVLATPDPPLVPQAISICEGQPTVIDALGDPGVDATGLTFEWTNSQGQVISTNRSYSIDSEEIYTITIANALGCSSTGDIFAGPPFEIELPEASTICQDAELILDTNVTANNYIWTVINPDNSTTTLPNQRRATVDSSLPGEYLYVVSIEDPVSIGCFTNDSTRVTINPLATALAQNIVNPACGASDGSFELNLTSSGVYDYTVTGNSAGTVDQGTLSGPINQLIGTLVADTYTVTLTDVSSGCINTIENIQVQNDPPDFTIGSITPSDADCSNPTGSLLINLSGNVFPISYVLTNTDNGSSSSGTVNSAIVASTFDFEIPGLSGGTYNIEVRSNSGCLQSQTGIVIDQPLPVELTTEPFVEVCGVNANLTASSTTTGATFLWTGPNGYSNTGANVNVPESGTYTVTASATGSCIVSQDVVVDLTIQPSIVINTIGDICDGEITLEAEVTNPQAGSTYAYSWSNGATSRTITVSASGDYTVTARHADNITCFNQVTENVSIPEELSATLSSSPACDDGSPITLTVNVTSGTATNIVWTRNGQSVGSGQSINIQDEGSYTATLSNATNCTFERSINIRRQAIPEGELPDIEYFCSTRTNNPILLAGRGFATYEWTRDGQPYPAGGRTLTVNEPGDYIVTMTTAIGCVQTDTVTIIESCDPEVVAPNAFAPSSDPPNNTFSVFPNDFVDNFVILIYNRWGELIYQSNTLEFKWDGTVNGELVQVGTYPYIMKYTSLFEPERGTFEQQGSVVVIR